MERNANAYYDLLAATIELFNERIQQDELSEDADWSDALHELLPGRVIKVGFKKEDSGAAYVAFCRMHQGRVGIPNVYHVARHAGCYTVVLDELEPCNRSGNHLHDHYADLAFYFVECDFEPEGGPREGPSVYRDVPNDSQVLLRDCVL